MLSLSLTPRYSIYVDTDFCASFIVDAAISRIHGTSFANAYNPQTLSITVTEDSSKTTLVRGTAKVGSTGNLYRFRLGRLKPRLQPYSVTLTAKANRNGQIFTTSTELFYLPAKRTGSMVKIDNLNGGMLFANSVNKFKFQPILPFGFYTSCSGFLTGRSNVTLYKNLGLTAINPVCALPDGGLENMFDWLDDANIPYQYDMRGYFYNMSSLEAQVPQMKDRSGLLSWYTADEPDGWQYSFASSDNAYQYLKRVDPYHPTGLVLNCQNYYFDKYTTGTDYIMEDAYPIGINATFSKWGTVCNSTYGDCGCDNCVGELRDVSDRLDDFYKYQSWLGRRQKPLWTVAQAFGNSEYWKRTPTAAEAWAMNLLGFNHRSKAVMSWLFPSDDALNQAYGKMAKVFAVSPVSDFILGGHPTPIKLAGHPHVDAASWILNGRLMVSIVSQDYSNSLGTVSLPLPVGAWRIQSQPWGDLSWAVSGSQLQVKGLPSLATGVVILSAM